METEEAQGAIEIPGCCVDGIERVARAPHLPSENVQLQLQIDSIQDLGSLQLARQRCLSVSIVYEFHFTPGFGRHCQSHYKGLCSRGRPFSPKLGIAIFSGIYRVRPAPFFLPWSTAM